MSRTVLHCDCNSFYASVETALEPKYKNVPMAVCGKSEDRHGIVLAKNELAKKYKIETAETVYSAKRKCPELVIVEPHHSEYIKYSARVNAIYAKYTDIIEPFGIDESWLDVTASSRFFGSGLEIAEKIRKEVKEEIGITVSIGVSFNKVFAKLGSDYKKPDAITVIDEDNFKRIVYPLPVSALLYVGKKTAEELRFMGIKTIGELAEMSRELLVRRLGKNGEMLYRYANGLDSSPVQPSYEDEKSMSNGFTFKHDLVSREECRTGIMYLAEELGQRLRAQSQLCRTVSLTIKDKYMRSIQRQKTGMSPTDIAREISDIAYSILSENWSEDKPIRMITVSVSGLIRADTATVQLSLFDKDTNEKNRDKIRKREEAVDKIRQKCGEKAALNASVIVSDIGIYETDEN